MKRKGERLMDRKPVTGFITFADVANTNTSSYGASSANSVGAAASNLSGTGSTGNSHSNSYAVSPLYTGTDTELARLSKKLLKKDVNTRIKGFSEVVEILSNANNDPTVAADFLPYFVHVYSKACSDNSWQVRKLLNKVLQQIIATEKTLLKPFMKFLIGHWWMMVSDPDTEVSNAAFDAFVSAIGPKRRQIVLLYLSSHILRQCQENINADTAAIIAATQCTQEEADERYSRIIISTISCIGKLIDSLFVEQNNKLFQSSSEDGTTIEAAIDRQYYNYGMILKEKFWKKFLCNGAAVRKVLFRLLSIVAEKVPQLSVLDNDAADFTPQQIANRKKMWNLLIKSCVGETNQTIVENALDAFVSILKNRPEVVATVTINEDIFPALKALISTVPDTVVNYMVPIVSYLPAECVAVFSSTTSSPSTVSSTAPNSCASEMVSLLSWISTNYLNSESIKPSIQWSLAVMEMSAVLLLRKHVTSNLSYGSATTNDSIGETFSFLRLAILRSIEDLVDSRATAIMGGTSSTDIRESLVEVYDINTDSPLNSDSRDAMNRLSQIVLQLHRASTKQSQLNHEDWQQYLWDPLASEMVPSPTSKDDNTPSRHITALRMRYYFETLATIVEASIKSESSENKLLSVPGLVSRWITRAKDTIYSTEVVSTSGVSDLQWSFTNVQFLAFMQNKLSFSEEIISNLILHKSLLSSFISLYDRYDREEDLESCLMIEVMLESIVKYVANSCNLSEKAYAELAVVFVEFVDLLMEKGSVLTMKLLLQITISCDIKCFLMTSLQQKWIFSSVEEFLNGTSNDSSSRHSRLSEVDGTVLIVSLCLSPISGNLGTAILTLLEDRWLSNRKATFCMLSLLASVLRNGHSNKYFMSREKEVILPAAEWTLERTSELASTLSKIFFSRDRGGPASTFAPFGDLIALQSWSEVDNLLLPELPVSVQLEFLSSVMNVLNRNVQRKATIFAEIGDSSESQAFFQPKKWARHLDALNAIALRLNLTASSYQNSSFISHKYWMAVTADILKVTSEHLIATVPKAAENMVANSTLNYVISALLELHANYRSTFLLLANESPVLIEMIVFLIATSQLLDHKLVRFDVSKKEMLLLLETLAMKFYGTDSYEKIKPTLDYVYFSQDFNNLHGITNWRSKVASVYTFRRYSLLKEACYRLLRLSWQPNKQSSTSAFKLIGVKEELRSGDKVWVIRTSDNEDQLSITDMSIKLLGNSYFPHFESIELIDATVIAIHRDNGFGEDAYYTLSLADSNNNQREIQAETYKLLLTDSKVNKLIPEITSVYYPADLIEKGSVNLQKERSDNFSEWLEQSLIELIQSIENCFASESFDEGVFQQVECHLGLFCEIICSYGNSVLADKDTRDSHMLFKRLIPVLCGLANCLLSRYSTQKPTREGVLLSILGLQLLQTLCSITVLQQNSSWIVLATHKVRVILRDLTRTTASLQQCSITVRDTEKVVTEISLFLSILLHKKAFSRATEMAESILVVGLPLLPSSYNKLTNSLIDLLKNYWKTKAFQKTKDDNKGFLQEVPSWEVEGFDLVLFIFVEGMSRIGDEIQLECAEALHYCLLGRSRESTRLLLVPSLLVKFSDKLLSMVVSPIANDLGCLLKLTASKLLDSWTICRNENSEKITALLQSTTTLEQSEKEEEVRCQQLFEAVVGSDVYSCLMRLASNKAQSSKTVDLKKLEILPSDDKLDEAEEEGLISEGDGQLELILIWLLCLQKIDVCSHSTWTVRAECGQYLKRSFLLKRVLDKTFKTSRDLLALKDVAGYYNRLLCIVPVDGSKAAEKSEVDHSVHGTISQLATYAIFRTVCILPAMIRAYWNEDCSRVVKQKLSKFIEERVRYSLIGREIALITQAEREDRWNKEEFSIRGSAVSGEVTATYVKEETAVEMKISVPPSYPLKNVDVSCSSRIGVTDGRWRRWVLQIIQLLSQQDGSVVEAALLWKTNMEKELDGCEPCPICYSVIHTKTQSLPTLACPTCNNKFHNDCLFTWFRSSGKSKCVICQQQFFH